jgi:hypothetical protein
MNQPLLRKPGSCLGKRRHANVEDANREASRLLRWSSRYRSYACERCGGWHVGRRRLG